MHRELCRSNDTCPKRIIYLAFDIKTALIFSQLPAISLYTFTYVGYLLSRHFMVLIIRELSKSTRINTLMRVHFFWFCKWCRQERLQAKPSAHLELSFTTSQLPLPPQNRTHAVATYMYIQCSFRKPNLLTCCLFTFSRTPNCFPIPSPGFLASTINLLHNRQPDFSQSERKGE